MPSGDLSYRLFLTQCFSDNLIALLGAPPTRFGHLFLLAGFPAYLWPFYSHLSRVPNLVGRDRVYTQAFNRRHHRVGHLFQGRFTGILVQKDSHFLEVCRYVVLNPVGAKMVKHPREWAWSSYRGTAGQASIHPCLAIEEVLSHFGARRNTAQEKYREYVSEGIGQSTIWENLEAQSLLGLEGFAEALRGHVTGRQKLREIPKEQRLIGRVSLKKLFERAGRGKLTRDRLIAEAVYQHGYSQVEVARHLGLHYSTVSRLMKSVNERARVKT